MFARIMAVVMAAILITAVCLSGIWWITLRDQQIDARLDYLISEAEDIAYMAANLNGSMMGFWGSTARENLNAKADKVNQEFGAYIAVVDRMGNVMDNIQTAYSEDPDFVKSLSGEAITEALRTVLQGYSIRIRSDEGQSPTFTVGVPFIQNGFVSGAVFIQTKAQEIESGLDRILFMIILVTGVVLIITGVALFLFIRSAMKPLRKMKEAAGSIADGNFEVRVDENRGGRELKEVSRAFNTMTQKLQGVEEGRREFVSNVSHELRSPITSIRGFAEGMADGVIPPEEHPKYLRLVADESTRLSGLVSDLLALSRLERDDVQLEMSVFDINEMLRTAVIRRMADVERKKIDIACEPETDPCYVRCDRDRIEQVVINLLDNAIKFTGEGGRITLSSRVRGDKAEITVWDNGCGIPEEDREKIFDRFFTADRAHTAGKGTGLGLSICKRIIDMHGESLRLLDTVEGAAFRFTVAHAEKPEDGQAEQPAEEQAEESENGQTEQPAEDLQSERLDGDEADQA